MINNLTILPIVFQFLAGIILLFCWGRIGIQKTLSILFSLISLGIAVWLFDTTWTNGIQISHAGNWDSPFGISFVSDVFGATMVLLTAISGLAVSMFASGSLRIERIQFGFFPILHFLLMGLSGAFLAGDIFNLYVWFEVVIISSFVLLTLGGKKKQLEGAMKYVSLNLLASSLFLVGIGFIYGLTGTLNFADVALKIAEIPNRGLVNATAGIFFVAFGIKSAIFPLYFWLPASYHTPPAAVSAIFGGLMTKLGVYSIIRCFSLMFGGGEFLGPLFSVVAALTILSGGMGAVLQKNLNKIFGYLIVCHIGFMMAGLGMYTELAIMGAIFYLIHDIVVKTNLFMISGLVLKMNGTENIDELGGMYRNHALLSLLLAVPLFSLVGFPPLSGFWSKIFLIQGGFESGEVLLIAAIIVGSFITLWVIGKVWLEVFWKNGESLPRQADGLYFHQMSLSNRWLMVLPIAFLAAVSLFIGFGAEHIMQVSQKISHDLLNPAAYIQSVLDNQSSKP
jgi:multicomponent Na+:H+ antiporter subunit D